MTLELILGFAMIIVISVMSLVGAFFLSMKEKTLDKVLFALVAFATGIMLATGLLDLIPESLHHVEELAVEGILVEEEMIFLSIVIGFIVFFFIERFIYWFHGHAHAHEHDSEVTTCVEAIEAYGGKVPSYAEGTSKGEPKVKNFALLNLIGDGMHNFLDGVVIMVAFLTDVTVGITITLAVVLHEIPQEIGDFAVLMYGGFTRKKALLFNFASAMVAVAGGIAALLLSEAIEIFNAFILAFSAGGFIYIAAVEMMPELIKEKALGRSFAQALIMIGGILTNILLMQVLPHA